MSRKPTASAAAAAPLGTVLPTARMLLLSVGIARKLEGSCPQPPWSPTITATSPVSATSSPPRRCPGALPVGQNSPQRPPLGPVRRAAQRHRRSPRRGASQPAHLALSHPALGGTTRRISRIDNGSLRRRRSTRSMPTPNRLRWDPLPLPDAPDRFHRRPVARWLATATPAARSGVAIHLYRANRVDAARYFWDADGELLIVPQLGGLAAAHRAGPAAVAPGEIAVIPRGVRFRVELPDGAARGYVCENYGAPFCACPSCGPIGANGLANPRDFLTPVAWFEDRDDHGRGGAEIRREPVGDRARPLAAGRGRLARQLRAVQVRSRRASWRSTRSASIIPTRRSSPC